MLRGAVERVRTPGCKFDYIVVLEGEQGTGKSTVVQILAGGPWFSDKSLIGRRDKERIEALEGVWIYELGELDGIRRADLSALKAFASRQVDAVRPAYGRFKLERPRRSIMIGTTNEKDYLRDPTGERRFLPLETTAIDLDGLRAERDQLMAEAWAANDPVILPHELWEDAAKLQQGRRQADPWEEVLSSISGEEHHRGFERVRSVWLFTQALEVATERQNVSHATRLRDCMRALGWQGPKTIRFREFGSQKGYIRACTCVDCLIRNETIPL